MIKHLLQRLLVGLSRLLQEQERVPSPPVSAWVPPSRCCRPLQATAHLARSPASAKMPDPVVRRRQVWVRRVLAMEAPAAVKAPQVLKVMVLQLTATGAARPRPAAAPLQAETVTKRAAEPNPQAAEDRQKMAMEPRPAQVNLHLAKAEEPPVTEVEHHLAEAAGLRKESAVRRRRAEPHLVGVAEVHLLEEVELHLVQAAEGIAMGPATEPRRMTVVESPTEPHRMTAAEPRRVVASGWLLLEAAGLRLEGTQVLELHHMMAPKVQVVLGAVQAKAQQLKAAAQSKLWGVELAVSVRGLLASEAALVRPLEIELEVPLRIPKVQPPSAMELRLAQATELRQAVAKRVPLMKLLAKKMVWVRKPLQMGSPGLSHGFATAPLIASESLYQKAAAPGKPASRRRYQRLLPIPCAAMLKPPR